MANWFRSLKTSVRKKLKNFIISNNLTHYTCMLRQFVSIGIMCAYEVLINAKLFPTYMPADVYKQMLIVQGSKRRFACAWGSGLKNSVV